MKNGVSNIEIQHTTLIPKYIKNLLSNLQKLKDDLINYNCNSYIMRIIKDFESWMYLFRDSSKEQTVVDSEINDAKEKMKNEIKKLIVMEYEIIYLFIKINFKENILTIFDTPKTFEEKIKTFTINLNIDKYSNNNISNIFDIDNNSSREKDVENNFEDYLNNINNSFDSVNLNNSDSHNFDILEEYEEIFVDECFIPNKPENSKSNDKASNILNFDEIKKNLFFFINILSKDNIYFDNDQIKSIYQMISKNLSLQNNNLFIIQNSNINSFIKSFNFEDISLDQIRLQPITSKFNELKSLKYELLIKEYHFKKNLFDNRGNFLSPNSRQNIFRGKEKYDPPYNWIGIGLNVIGKYEDDKWLNDISDKSEWAIAYRGIGANISPENIKKYLLYFIVNDKGLNIAISSSKSQSLDTRRRKKVEVGDGIYLTPYIQVAEEYTQNIIFNKKKYKILLMAKVKIDKIRQPEGTSFWVLNDEDIRIYRILFKSIE